MSEFKAQIIADDGSRRDLEGVMSVGRTSSCDIFIDEPRISRNHAEIRTEGQKVTIEDLGSANGTKVNGEALNNVRELRDGDRVTFDKIQFSVEINNPAEQTVIRTQDTVVEMPAVVPPAAEPDPSGSKTEKQGVDTDQPDPTDNGEAEPEAAIESEPQRPSTAQSSPTPDIPSAWVEDDDSHTKVIRVDQIPKMPDPVPQKKAELPDRTSELPHLIVFSPGASDYIVELETGTGGEPDVWEIGRSPGSQILLEEASVSSRHAQLIHERGRWQIVNLVSSNGIFINGDKRLKTFLSDGDEIKLGLVRMTFRATQSDTASQSRGSSNPDSYAPGDTREESRSSPAVKVVVVLVVVAALIAAAAWFGLLPTGDQS